MTKAVKAFDYKKLPSDKTPEPINVEPRRGGNELNILEMGGGMWYNLGGHHILFSRNRKDGNFMKAKKLPSGRYRTQLVVGYDEQGKRMVKSFTAPTAWQSEKMAADYRTKYGIGQSVFDLTVSGAITRYINSRTNTVSPVTIRTYLLVRDTRLQSLMDKKITELTVADVQNAVNLDAEKLSAKSISEAVSLVQAAMSFQGIDKNFKKRITLPKKRTKKKVLAPPEVIIQVVKGTKLELPCLLAMWLSLRISEVRGLKYSDISRDGKMLSVQRALVYVDGKNIENDYNKTIESTRTIPLPKYLYDMIMEQPHKNKNEYIVNLGYNCIYKGFKSMMKEYGYDMHFHALRAVFATTLTSMRIPDSYVQGLGGWSNPITMHRHYVHTLSSDEQRYQRQINDYFGRLLEEAE